VTTPAEPKSGGNVFTRKIGPLPLWAWMGILAAIALAYYLIKSKGSSSSSDSSDSSDTAGAGGVDSSLVPQFVNQTYVNNTPPPAPTAKSKPAKNGAPVTSGGKQENLTRTWTSEGGSTYASVAQRLTGTADPSALTPENAAAKNWVDKVYSKNKNAKMPKGLTFTYKEGTVTSK
jgi:hypothetical protein